MALTATEAGPNSLQTIVKSVSTRQAGSVQNQHTFPKEWSQVEERDMFQYEQLQPRSKEIRLLEMLPGEETDIVRCNLRTFNLCTMPAYVALSYTWIRDGKYQHIECNKQQLRISKSLGRFLKQFRTAKSGDIEFLWIDAICINQTDVGERNHQVGQMRDIYSRASLTIAWLGPSSQDAVLAFEMAAGRKKLVFSNHQDFRQYRSKKQWSAFASLLNKPYWSRVWIIQEFTLATTIELWCGELSAPWSGFEHICQSLERLAKPSRPHTESACVLTSRGSILAKQRSEWCRRHSATSKQSASTLLQLLQAYGGAESSDIRDKVFALLGLAYSTFMNEGSMVADYSKTKIEVLVDVIRHEFQWGSIEHDTSNRDFARLLRESLKVTPADLAAHITKCAPDLSPHIHCLATTERVYVPMILAGSIVEAGFKERPEGLYSTRTFRQWHKHRSNIHIDPERLGSTIVSALRACLEDSDTREIMDLDLPKSFGKQDRTCSVSKDQAIVIQAPQSPSTPQSTSDTLGRATHKRAYDSSSPLEECVSHVFVGTNGLVGVTKAKVQHGDGIYTFATASNERAALIMRCPTGYGISMTVGTAAVSKPSTATSGIQLTNDVTPSNAALVYLRTRPAMNESIYDCMRRSEDFTNAAEYVPQKLVNDKCYVRDFEFTRSPHTPAPSQTLRFYCDPNYLPSLAQCKLVKQAFVPSQLERIYQLRIRHVFGHFFPSRSYFRYPYPRHAESESTARAKSPDRSQRPAESHTRPSYRDDAPRCEWGVRTEPL